MGVREQLETWALRKIASATVTEFQAGVTEHSSRDLETLSAICRESGPLARALRCSIGMNTVLGERYLLGTGSGPRLGIGSAE